LRPLARQHRPGPRALFGEAIRFRLGMLPLIVQNMGPRYRPVLDIGIARFPTPWSKAAMRASDGPVRPCRRLFEPAVLCMVGGIVACVSHGTNQNGVDTALPPQGDASSPSDAASLPVNRVGDSQPPRDGATPNQTTDGSSPVSPTGMQMCAKLCSRLAACERCPNETTCQSEACKAACLEKLGDSPTPACAEGFERWLECGEATDCRALEPVLPLWTESSFGSSIIPCIDEALGMGCDSLIEPWCGRQNCNSRLCAFSNGEPACACTAMFIHEDEPPPMCEAVNDCAGSACGAGQICLDEGMRRRCACPAGQALDATGACQDAADCHPPTGAQVTLTIRKKDDGFGDVIVSDGLCTDSCTASLCAIKVAQGAVVRVEPFAKMYSKSRSLSGCTSAGDGTCTWLATEDHTITARFRLAHNVAFMTSSVHAGDFGGSAGGARICAERAREAGLHGTKWLAVTNAAQSFDTAIVGNPGGWVRTDGRPLALSVNALFDLAYPLALDERGRPVDPAVSAWSGGASGCSDFSSKEETLATRLINARANQGWDYGQDASCSESHSIACFGLDNSSPLPVAYQASGTIAFATSNNFYPRASSVAEALESADALCQAEACDRGLLEGYPSGSEDCWYLPKTEGRFKALLSTTTTTAASRVNPPDGALLREDGLPWAVTPADLLSGSTLTGLSSGSPPVAYTGFIDSPDTLAASLEDTCHDWTIPSAFDQAAATDPHESMFARRRAPCNGASIICVESTHAP